MRLAAATILPAKSCWSPPAARARRSIPVRFLGNRSSGKMGYALAEAAQSRGAKVILISGPSALHPPAHCELVKVTTADEMRDAVLERMTEATLVIKAAAVADYRPVAVSPSRSSSAPVRSRWSSRPLKTFWPKWCAAAVPGS